MLLFLLPVYQFTNLRRQKKLEGHLKLLYNTSFKDLSSYSSVVAAACCGLHLSSGWFTSSFYWLNQQ